MFRTVRKLLVEKNAPDFAVDGKRAVRTVGGCILAAGLLCMLAGCEAGLFGHTGMARYEKKSGRLIRMISSEDQTYYAGLVIAARMGIALQLAGFAIAALGTAAMLRPFRAYRACVACRIIRGDRRVPSS